MCSSGAICLPRDSFFSELAPLKSHSACWSTTKCTSPSFHWQFNLWYSWRIAELALNTNQSITHSIMGHGQATFTLPIKLLQFNISVVKLNWLGSPYCLLPCFVHCNHFQPLWVDGHSHHVHIYTKYKQLIRHSVKQNTKIT